MILRLLYKKPYIIYLPTSDLASDHINFLRKYLYKETVYFILYSNGYISETIAETYKYYIQPRYRNANHHFIFLANSKQELDIYKKYTIDARLINHNAFINPKFFNILDIEKKYKAIYNARFSFLKRHYLASHIDGLACLCWGFFKHYEKPLYEKLKTTQNIILLNDIKDNDIIKKMPQEVNYCYNESYVGLCLSFEEGAMYSSVEYLLSGLPVVSTNSNGGRDLFFDNNNSIITNDDPIEISEAVDYFIKNYETLDRNLIRNNAIKQQGIFIEKFKTLISEILYKHNISIDIDKWWKNHYTHKIVKSYININNFIDDELRIKG